MLNQSQWKKPLPTITGETRKFWDAARKGHLMIQHCNLAAINGIPEGFVQVVGQRTLNMLRQKVQEKFGLIRLLIRIGLLGLMKKFRMY